MSDLADAARALAERTCTGKTLVALTGAGISAESGIPTFRGEGGLWTKYRPEDVATAEAFFRDPAQSWRFHDELRRLCHEARPNPGDLGLARMQADAAAHCESAVITQNIDHLHQDAGSTRVIELHGDIMRARCLECNATTEELPVPLEEVPPRCECGGLLRPDVVWFGELLPEEAIGAARRWSERAGAMLVIGTSATVEPAASLPLIARMSGALLIEVNPEPTALTGVAEFSLRGTAGQLMPQLAELFAHDLR